MLIALSIIVILALGVGWIVLYRRQLSHLITQPKPQLVKIILVLSSCILLAVGFLPIDPPAGPSTLYNKNLDVYLVLDTSLSMKANDYAGNKTRLDGMKTKLGESIEALNGARFTLISFHGRATVELPGMYDTTVLREQIQSLEPPTLYDAQGTAFAPALQLVTDRIERARKQDNLASMRRVVIIVSDGEQVGKNNESDTAIKAVREKIDSALVLGVGTKEGATMKVVWTNYGGPNYDQPEEKYVTDPTGKSDGPKDEDGIPIAVSKADFDNLKRIATGLNGKFAELTPNYQLKSDLTAFANTTELKDRGQTTNVLTAPNQYYWFGALVALILLVIFRFLPRRSTRTKIRGGKQ